MNGKRDKANSVNLSELRVIEDLEFRKPALNVALEESIARSVSQGNSPPTLRFWRDDYSAIIGRSQVAGSELDLARCRDRSIPVVRRPTGGGTVLHHPENLNYSLYLPEPGSGSVEEEAIRLSEPVNRALGKQGLVRSNGLFVDGMKVGGTAQSRRWGLLHHGTLLITDNAIMKEMDEFLRAQREDYEELRHQVASEPAKVTSLERLLGRRIGLSELIDAIMDKFAELLDLTPVKGEVNPGEWLLANHLFDRKYSSSSWTLRFTEKVDLNTKHGKTNTAGGINDKQVE